LNPVDGWSAAPIGAADRVVTGSLAVYRARPDGSVVRSRAVEAWDPIVAVGTNGDVYVSYGNPQKSRIERVHAATGATVWSRVPAGSATGRAKVVSALADGDVLVCTELPDVTHAARYSASSGATVWERAFVRVNYPTSCGGSDDGGMVVSARLPTLEPSIDVRLLAAANGADAWHVTRPLALTGLVSADLDAGGVTLIAIQASRSRVARLSRLDGTGLWDREVTGNARRALRLPDGSLAVFGAEAGGVARVFVERLGAADGASLWRFVAPATIGFQILRAETLLSSGDVAVAVTAADPIGSRTTLHRVRVADGTSAWSVALPDGEASSTGTAVAVPPARLAVLATGESLNAPTLRVHTLDTNNGTGPMPLVESLTDIPITFMAMRPCGDSGALVAYNQSRVETPSSIRYGRASLIKLDATTGLARWRDDRLGDAAGNESAIGSIACTTLGDAYERVTQTVSGTAMSRYLGKRDGASGLQVWQQPSDVDLRAAFDERPLLAAAVGGAPGLRVLDAATGLPAWETQVPGNGVVRRLSGGDIVSAGSVPVGSLAGIGIARLNSASGAPVSRSSSCRATEPSSPAGRA
jgi:outer membrane protein assembly factor BamB